MSGWSHHDRLPVSVTQGSGDSVKPGISPAGVCSLVPPHRQEGFREEPPQWRRRAEEGLAPPGRHLATPGLVPVDRLPDAEQGKADRAGSLAA